MSELSGNIQTFQLTNHEFVSHSNAWLHGEKFHKVGARKAIQTAYRQEKETKECFASIFTLFL